MKPIIDKLIRLIGLYEKDRHFYVSDPNYLPDTEYKCAVCKIAVFVSDFEVEKTKAIAKSVNGYLKIICEKCGNKEMLDGKTPVVRLK